MLRLLGRAAVSWLAADEGEVAEDVPIAVTDAQKEEILRHAERELMDLQQLLGVMHKQGFRDSEEYRELVALYAQLSRSITEAIKSSGLAATLAVSAATAKAAGRGGTGGGPKRLKETIGKQWARFNSSLGPATMRGMTSQGIEVENLQRVLNFERISVNIDGIYSPETMVAVRMLQKKYGINATGVVGSDTRRLLNILVGNE